MKNDVNLLSKSKKQKNFPDLLVRGTDPRIRIRTNMSRIRNTVFSFLFILLFGIHSRMISDVKVRIAYEYLPARHVKGVEEVGNPLDGAGDELNVLPVHPIRLNRTKTRLADPV